MSAPTLASQPNSADPRPSILLVEDHDQVRSLLRDWLSAIFPQFAFPEAASGEQAIQLAAAHQPRLVLMDISLPGISGLEAARIILSNQPATRLVMLSIHDELSYRNDAAHLGASAFVSKATMRTTLIPALIQALEFDDESPI